MKNNNDATFSFEKAEDSTGLLLWRVTNFWQRAIKKALEKYQLTHAQFVLLASAHWLIIHEQEVTQVILSTHTQIDPMTTSTVLRTLQSKGLLQRKEHAKDTRAKTIILTTAGIKIIKEAVKTVESFDADFFSPLGKETARFNEKLLALLSQ